MASNSAFRTCPDTGLKIHLPAQALIKANAVVAVVFLLIGGLLASTFFTLFVVPTLFRLTYRLQESIAKP